MTTNHRRTAAALGLALTVGLVSACNPDRAGGGADASLAPTPNEDGAVAAAPSADASGAGGELAATGTLTTMGFGYETGDEIAQVRVDAFKEAYPDVTLEVGEGAFDEQVFLSSVAAFQQGFQFLHMGYASAMAWLLFVVIITLTLVQLRLSRRWVYYEGES